MNKMLIFFLPFMVAFSHIQHLKTSNLEKEKKKSGHRHRVFRTQAQTFPDTGTDGTMFVLNLNLYKYDTYT